MPKELTAVFYVTPHRVSNEKYYFFAEAETFIFYFASLLLILFVF